MDKSSIVKLRNYFSDRIEEIQDGTYVPTFEKIKEMPEFIGTKRETFRIARRGWYSQHFGMSFLRYSKRMGAIKESNLTEKEYDKKYGHILSNAGPNLGFVGGTMVIWAGAVLILGYIMSYSISPQLVVIGTSILIMGILGVIGGRMGKIGKRNIGGIFLILAGIGAIISCVVTIFVYPSIFGIPTTWLLPLGGILFLLGGIINKSPVEEKRIISEIPELESALELSLRDKVEALITSPNTAKKFYISVRNRNSNIVPDVKVQLSGPPQVKIVDATKSYGSVGGFSSRSARFTILAEETGTFTLTATLKSKVEDEITLPIEIRVKA